MTQRTAQQNKSLHKGLQLVADSLNQAGLDMRVVLKPEIDIPWTTASAKEYLFRPIMEKMHQKSSTTLLDKHKEIEEVWETMMRFLMEKHHIDYIPFPHNEQNEKEYLKSLDTMQ